MELSQLYYFYKTASLEHITKASLELNIAQPALTKSLHKLEEELSIPLFSHQGRNIKLTPWGLWLFNKLKDPLNSILNIKNEIASLKNSSHIKICAKVASIFITDAILAFKKKYPSTTFTLLQEEDKNADILVEIKDFGYPEMIRIGYGNSFKNKIKSIKDIENLPIITFTHFKEFRDLIDDFFSKNSITPKISFECDNLNSIHDLILNNEGIGFIPEFTQRNLNDDLNLMDIHLKRFINVSMNPYGINNHEILKEFYDYLNLCFKEKQILKL